MKVNIILNENLVREAFKYSTAKTKRDLIHQALEEFIKTRSGKTCLTYMVRLSLQRITTTKI